MKRSGWIVAVAVVVPAPGAASQRPNQASFVPTGAKIEGSSFATVERAPPVPYPDEPPPPEHQPQGPAAWYARDLGISYDEAERRQSQQQTLRPEFERLIALLQVREAGNFTGPRIVHKPDWAFVLYFKRDPERTLAKYTNHPGIRAAPARYTREELAAVVKPWVDRFASRNIAGGWGMDATFRAAEIMMNVTEEEYRAIADREGWGPVPQAVRLAFSAPLAHVSVEDQAKPFVRIFAQNSRSAIRQPEAGFFGRITMRDGCLYSGNRLAYFHRESGIGLDEQGYLAIRDRRTGKSTGRIGEWFVWAGPNQISEDMPMVRELRQRCGAAPIDNVGNPESAAQFRVQAHRIDALAERRRISRKRAWELLKQCWRKADAAKPDAPPDDLVKCN